MRNTLSGGALRADARIDDLIRRNRELQEEVAVLKSILTPAPPDEYRALGLSKREAVILRVLASASPEIVSLDRIAMAAEFDRGRALNYRGLTAAYCNSIRKKLAGSNVRIINEYGVGYGLIGKAELNALIKKSQR